MQAVVQPEVMAIQKKYKNKKDQASMLKQQEEIQQVYDKYGVSMMGGCLPLLIQMPFLFALYPVIYRISDYVPNITAQANKFLTIPDMTITPGNMLSMAKAERQWDIQRQRWLSQQFYFRYYLHLHSI